VVKATTVSAPLQHVHRRIRADEPVVWWWQGVVGSPAGVRGNSGTQLNPSPVIGERYSEMMKIAGEEDPWQSQRQKAAT